MIKHKPLFDTTHICETYSRKDGVPIKYVCTTDLKRDDTPVDIFYRATPHPEFGNKYFGIFWDTWRDTAFITNADFVETLEFGMVEDANGDLHYSQSRHDYFVTDSGNMIDGGRAYIRSSGAVEVYKVKDGEFVNEQSS